MTSLSIAIGNTGFAKVLKTGHVDTLGLDLQFVEIDPITNAMRSMVRKLDLDICEMAFATYLCAKSFSKPITAIPVFLTRKFHHGSIFCNARAKIRRPSDLESQIVANNRGYTVTTGIWARGILESEYGVDLKKITWMPTADEHVEEFVAPENVDYSYRGQPIVDLLLSEKCAAAVGDIRSDHDDIQPLIPNASTAALDSYRRTGVYPINHLLVVKDSCLDANPNLAKELFNIFRESKVAYMRQLHASKDLSETDERVIELESAIGDPFPLGIDKNKRAIDAFLQLAVNQQVIGRKPSDQELFADGTLGVE